MTKLYCILVGFILMFMYSCGNDLNEVKKFANEERVPISSTKNVEMLYSDSARLRAKINAPLRETYVGKDGYIEFPKGIKVEFYGVNTKLESKLKANYAKSFTGQERMEAKNNVVIESTSGDKLETEHLIWDQRQDRIFSNVFTRITSPDRVIYGDGFESNQDFSKYRILKVKGIINLNE